MQVGSETCDEARKEMPINRAIERKMESVCCGLWVVGCVCVCVCVCVRHTHYTHTHTHTHTQHTYTFKKSLFEAQEAICHKNVTVNSLMTKYMREEGRRRDRIDNLSQKCDC
jgi:hypothetical protein